MNAEELRETLRREPFRPFRFRLRDGRLFYVRNPEQVLLAKGFAVVAERYDAEGYLERSHRITLSEVTSLEVVESEESEHPMSAQEFLQIVRRRPFVPFRIYLTDGTSYDIRHPEMVWVLRTRVDIAIPADRDSGLVDRVEFVSLLHIVRVEDLEPAASQPN